MKLKLAVLFGGKSVEHEISIISALQAIHSLDKEKYDILPIYITKNNDFYTGDAAFEISEYKNIPELLKKLQKIIIVSDGGKTFALSYPHKPFSKDKVYEIDVAFPIVHGTNVEDGSLQGYLKTLNLPFVGCDVLSSAVGMDKYVMKAVLKDNGIPVLECLCFNSNDFDYEQENMLAKIEEKFGYPVIVKPINLGSSVGISKADSRDKLTQSLADAFMYAEKVLVEPAIVNLKEINCAVLGDFKEAVASECEEPVTSDEILSYDEKYGGNSKSSGTKGMASTKRKIPAEIPHDAREEIRSLAVRAFKVLGCSGVSRIDFMIDMDKGFVYLNEINTIPGSLSFYLWEPLGIKYSELLDKMIDITLQRKREQDSVTYAFDTNVLSGVSFGGSKNSKLKV